MAIKKSRVTSIRKVNSGFAISRDVIRRTSSSIDPLHTKGEESTDRRRGVDPSRFMTRKQRKAWKRLSPQKRKHYILQAQKEADRANVQKGVALKKQSKVLEGQGGQIDPETAKYLAGWKPGKTRKGSLIRSQKVLETRRRQMEKKGLLQSDSGTKQPSPDSLSSSAVQGNRQAGEIKSGFSGAMTDSGYTGSKKYGQPYHSGLNQIETMTSSGMSSSINTGTALSDTTLTVNEGVLFSSGVGAGAVIAKKAAEQFKADLRRKTLGQQSRRERLQSLQNLNNNGDGVLAERAGSYSIAMVVTMVFQAAVQMVASVVSVLSMILIPIAIVAMIVTLTISLLTSIGGAVDEADSWYMGGGMELVEVAIREIGYKQGADGSTKYGTWAGIGNANWCHAFVSWCANECGFIEEGIIPKTGSCETGRQWFIKRNEYQTGASYEPIAGDIVYFRHGNETVSHHVGIVEYSENGILHTIEGNSSGVVKRREYPLTASRILGYATPAYPDDGYGEFGSGQDFLKVVRTIGTTIVKDGNWRYSNSGQRGNFTDAKRSGPRVTNCALAISWCMQEFGTLKRNQSFYSDWNGNLTCNSAVRKRINKYYDIINVGGKRNANGVKLKPGDICLWNIHVNVYAGEENGKKVWYDFSRGCTSDKKANSGVYIKYIRKGGIGQTLYKVLRLKDQDSYGSGKQYKIPSGMGTSYTYMGWALIHDWPTRQNYLRKRSGEHYDRNGFAKVNGRYVIACTTTFGKVGDYIDFVLDNGKVIHAIMGDEKNQSDPGCNRWGHDNGRSVVEFVVKKSMWYGHLGNSDITRFHPEWKSRVKMGVNLGKNFFGK